MSCCLMCGNPVNRGWSDAYKTMAIKPTQLTRVGYSYQDLWCIKLLIDWFHQPELYQWMTIENSESGPHKFQGLDDVVALNSYGKYELYHPLSQNSCHPHPNNLNGGKGDNHGTIQSRTQTSNTRQTFIT